MEVPPTGLRSAGGAVILTVLTEKPMYLGDTVAAALARVGVDAALVTRWVGAPCGCDERRRKMNDLDRWARRVLRGKVESAGTWLRNLMGDDDGNRDGDDGAGV